MSGSSTVITVTALGITGIVSLASPYLAGRVQRSVQREALHHQQKQSEVAERRRVLSDAMQAIAEAATYLLTSLSLTDPARYETVIYSLTGSLMQVRLWFGREAAIAEAYSTCANAAMQSFAVRARHARAKAESDAEVAEDELNSERTVFRDAFLVLIDTATPLLETLESSPSEGSHGP